MAIPFEFETQNIEFPIKSHAFLVSIDGYPELTHAGFTQASGLSVNIQPFRVDEPARFAPYDFPDSQENPIITLVRGMDFSRALSQWLDEVISWTPEKPDYRRSVSIYLMRRQGDIAIAVRGWDLFGAWPLQWSAPASNANAAAIAFETIRLYCEEVVEVSLSSADVLNLNF